MCGPATSGVPHTCILLRKIITSVHIVLVGQRQFLCLTRVLLRKSKILVHIVSILVWASASWCALHVLS